LGLDRCGRGRAGVDSDVRAGGNDTEREVQIVCDNRKQRAYKDVDLGLSHPPNYQSPSLPSACLNLVQEGWTETVTVTASAWTLAAYWSLREVFPVNVRVVVEMSHCHWGLQACLTCQINV
jgi:hypothetical protein